MFVADTNVLVDAAHHRSVHHDACRQLIEAWQADGARWFVTWGICFEFLRIVTHPAIYRSPWSAAEGWRFLEGLFATGTNVLGHAEDFPSHVEELFKEQSQLAGNIMHDAHTAVLMREHGLRRIYTRDTDFHRFPFIEPIDPLRQS